MPDGSPYFVRVIRLQVHIKSAFYSPFSHNYLSVFKATSSLNFLLDVVRMSSPLSSSLSSLDSVFDPTISRSASSSSLESLCHNLSDIPLSHRPKNCVYAPIIQADSLKAIFESYAQGGFLGMYLPAGKPRCASTFANWDKISVTIKEGTQMQLYVTSFTENSNRVCDADSINVRSTRRQSCFS